MERRDPVIGCDSILVAARHEYVGAGDYVGC